MSDKVDDDAGPRQAHWDPDNAIDPDGDCPEGIDPWQWVAMHFRTDANPDSARAILDLWQSKLTGDREPWRASPALTPEDRTAAIELLNLLGVVLRSGEREDLDRIRQAIAVFRRPIAGNAAPTIPQLRAAYVATFTQEAQAWATTQESFGASCSWWVARKLRRYDPAFDAATFEQLDRAFSKATSGGQSVDTHAPQAAAWLAVQVNAWGFGEREGTTVERVRAAERDLRNAVRPPVKRV